MPGFNVRPPRVCAEHTWGFRMKFLRLDILAKSLARFGAAMAKAWARLGYDTGLWAVMLAVNLVVLAFSLVEAPLQVGAVYANNFAQYQLVADRILYILESQLAFSGLVNMRYGEEYEKQPHGPTLQVKRPPRFIGRTGDAVSLEGITQPTVTLNVQPVFGVDVPIGSSEMALITGDSLEDFDREFGTAMASQLATQFEQKIAALNVKFYNLVGTPGAPPTTLANLAPVQQRLDEENVPMADRSVVLSPKGKWSFLPGLTGNFVKDVIEETELRGRLKVPLIGFDKGLDMSQVAPSRTVGTWHAGALVDGGGQTGLTLNTKGWTAADQLNPGDVISITGVNAVNPQTRVSTGAKRQFVVVSMTAADAAGKSVITLGNPITPPIGGQSQQFQTVDSIPADGAAITVDSGTSGTTFSENLAFQRDAILVVTLPQPKFPGAFYVEDRKYNGIAYRIWIDGDIRNNQAIMRLDILAAFGVGNQEALVRWTN